MLGSRAMEMSQGYTLWEDFPSRPGEVITYVGKCEKYVVTSPQIRFFVDEDLQKRQVNSGPVSPSMPVFRRVQPIMYVALLVWPLAPCHVVPFWLLRNPPCICSHPRQTPWLRPAQGSVEIPAERFKVKFFVHPPTGE